MSATTIFVIGIIAAGLLAGAGVFVVAARRGTDAGPITGDFDRRAVRADLAARSKRKATAESAVATLVREETEEVHADADDGAAAAPETASDPLLDRQEVSPEEYGESRRRFLNRSLVGLFVGVFLGGQALAYLAFLWPKLRGGFGTPINVGKIEELREQIVGTTIEPKFVAAAQTWIVPFDPADQVGSSFEGLPVIAGGGGGEVGLMALWQRCVHLGCRVPSCVPSQGFECPCHGSKYNFHGEYFAGPAPRNMDRFGVEVTENGEMIVNTGDVFQTARASEFTTDYPQGPPCN